MPTKTTTKTASKPALPDWQSELSEELAKQEQRSRAAMGILLGAADGSELTAEELAFLRAAGVDDSARRREVNKMQRVIALYRSAGSSAQRKAAADRLASVEADLGPIVAKAQSEIDRLQGEINKAQRDLDAARLEADRRSSAAVALTGESLLPEFVRGQLSDIAKAQSGCDASAVIRETETRLKMIAGVLKLSDAEQMKLHAQAQQTQGRDLFTRQGDGGKMINPKVCPMKWAAYVADLRNEVPVLESQLAAADKQLDCFRRESADLREFWLSKEIEQQLMDLEVLPNG
jgi:hypothetical protein